MITTFKNKQVHYSINGKGPAIVLLHGFLESSTMWEPLLPLLSSCNTIVCIDLPGHGKTQILSEIHSMELMAEMVKSVLHDLNIDKATFIGHSMGGYVVLAYLELFPSDIKTLILINSTSKSDSDERISNRNRTIKLLSSNPKPYIHMAISNLVTSDSRKKFPEAIEKLKEEAISFPTEGLKSAVRGMRDRKDRTETLKDFEGNKYMVLSTEDPLISFEEASELALYTKSEIKEINGGHMSLIENPKSLARFLGDLLC